MIPEGPDTSKERPRRVEREREDEHGEIRDGDDEPTVTRRHEESPDDHHAPSRGVDIGDLT